MHEQGNRRKHVVVIGTGGTIASSGADAIDFHNYSVSSTVEQILTAVPEAGQIARLSSTQPANVDSFMIDNSVLLAVARAAKDAVQDDAVDGIVITHGTDTLEETAYFLHLVLPTNKPVVVVGAMRPATAMSADGPLNLFNAILAATNSSSVQKGVLVVVNGHIYSARDVMKRDTSSIDAIDGGKYGILGEISGKMSISCMLRSSRIRPTVSSACLVSMNCHTLMSYLITKALAHTYTRLPLQQEPRASWLPAPETAAFQPEHGRVRPMPTTQEFLSSGPAERGKA